MLHGAVLRDIPSLRSGAGRRVCPQKNPSEATWMIDDMGVPVKLGCAAQTWDITFCTEVCELAVGDECKPSNRNGDDRCSDELVCVETDFDTYTCQPTLDYSDYSSSSSLLGTSRSRIPFRHNKICSFFFCFLFYFFSKIPLWNYPIYT